MRFWIKVNQGADNDLVRVFVDGEDLGDTSQRGRSTTAPLRSRHHRRTAIRPRQSTACSSAPAFRWPCQPVVATCSTTSTSRFRVTALVLEGTTCRSKRTPTRARCAPAAASATGSQTRNRGRLPARNLQLCGSHPAPDDLRECRPQAASRRPPALLHDPALAARPTRQLPPRPPGQSERAGGCGDEHRRDHAASATADTAHGAGVAGRPARSHREAQAHRERQGQREDSQACEGQAAAVYGITAIAGPLGSERPSPWLCCDYEVPPGKSRTCARGLGTRARKRHLQEGEVPFRPAARQGMRQCTNLGRCGPGLTCSRARRIPGAAVRGVFSKFGLDEEQAADDVRLGAALDNVQGTDFCRHTRRCVGRPRTRSAAMIRNALQGDREWAHRRPPTWIT